MSADIVIAASNNTVACSEHLSFVQGQMEGRAFFRWIKMPLRVKAFFLTRSPYEML
jgi:hypothetical protein